MDGSIRAAALASRRGSPRIRRRLRGSPPIGRCGTACGRGSRPWRRSRSLPACASPTLRPPHRMRISHWWTNAAAGGAPARPRRRIRVGRARRVPGPGAPAEPMTQAAVSAFRTYVVEAAHPVEVRADGSSDLVQWLTARLGRPVTVPDLRTQGFRLMGGRLLPAGDEPAAMLMYDDDRGTRLTLYSRPGRPVGAACFAMPARTTWRPSRGSTRACPTW